MQKILIILGIIILLAGIFWTYVSKIPFGRLPGDIIIEKENVKIYIPIVSLLILSGLISFFIWLFKKF
jgi:hypothetical protein